VRRKSTLVPNARSISRARSVPSAVR
jgi:hypothetical protein